MHYPHPSRSAAMVLVLDLSHPYEIWNTMETLLKAALSRIEQVISKISAEDPRIYDRIKAKSWRRIGEDHPVRKSHTKKLAKLLHVI